MAFLVITSGFAAFSGSVAANDSAWDSETTTTSSTSDTTGTGYTIALNETNTSTAYYSEINGTSGDSYSLQFLVDDEVVYEKAMSEDGTTGHFNASFTHEELYNNLPRTYDGNDSITVQVYHDTAGSVGVSDTLTINSEDTDGDFEVARVNGDITGLSDLSATTSSAEKTYPGAWNNKYFGNEEHVADVGLNVPVNGSETAVVTTFSDESDAGKALNEATNDTDKGDKVAMQFSANGENYRVYDTELPSDSDASTYAVTVDQDDDGDADRVRFETGSEEFDNETTVDAELTINEDYSFQTKLSDFGPLSGLENLVPDFGGLGYDVPYLN